MKSFKSIAFSILIFGSVLSCKDTENEKKEELTAKEGSKVVKVEVSDFDRYEGRIVKASTGQWYLIKEGCRWRTNSIEATDDYLKKMPQGPNYVVENVSIDILKQFPEVGEILPGLNFKKDTIKPIKQ